MIKVISFEKCFMCVLLWRAWETAAVIIRLPTLYWADISTNQHEASLSALVLHDHQLCCGCGCPMAQTNLESCQMAHFGWFSVLPCINHTPESHSVFMPLSFLCSNFCHHMILWSHILISVVSVPESMPQFLQKGGKLRLIDVYPQMPRKMYQTTSHRLKLLLGINRRWFDC